MSHDDQGYDLESIRRLLLAAFDADELGRLCLDHDLLRPLHARFGPNDSLAERVDVVIGYCLAQRLFDELLAAVKEANPRQYEHFAPQIRAPESTPRRRWPWIAGGVLLVLLLVLIGGTWMAGTFSPTPAPGTLVAGGTGQTASVAGIPLPTSPTPDLEPTDTPQPQQTELTDTPRPQQAEPTDTATPAAPAEPSPAIAATRQALYETPANHCRWSPTGDWLAVAGYNLRIYDAQTLEEGYLLDSVQWPEAIAFSPDGTLLAVADDSVTLLEAGSWRQLRALAGSKGTGSLAFSPDGETLATATGGTVKLWEVGTGKELRTLPGGSGRAVVFASSGKLVAASGGVAGQEVLLWEVGSGRELPALTGHSNWINALAVDPDRGWLASGSTDGTVRLWDLAEMRQVRVLTGHKGEVEDVAFSPDGRLLASASWDLTVRLWEVATGRELATLTGHTAWIECADFSPDGMRLASGSGDQLLVWRLAMEP